MSDTPLYDSTCEGIADLHRNLERDGDAIADPAERMRYYQTIAAGMRDVERKFVAIRLRGEKYAKAGLVLAGMLPARRVRKGVLILALELQRRFA